MSSDSTTHSIAVASRTGSKRTGSRREFFDAEEEERDDSGQAPGLTTPVFATSTAASGKFTSVLSRPQGILVDQLLNGSHTSGVSEFFVEPGDATDKAAAASGSRAFDSKPSKPVLTSRFHQGRDPPCTATATAATSTRGSRGSLTLGELLRREGQQAAQQDAMMWRERCRKLQGALASNCNVTYTHDNNKARPVTSKDCGASPEVDALIMHTPARQPNSGSSSGGSNRYAMKRRESEAARSISPLSPAQGHMLFLRVEEEEEEAAEAVSAGREEEGHAPYLGTCSTTYRLHNQHQHHDATTACTSASKEGSRKAEGITHEVNDDAATSSVSTTFPKNDLAKEDSALSYSAEEPTAAELEGIPSLVAATSALYKASQAEDRQKAAIALWRSRATKTEMELQQMKTEQAAWQLRVEGLETTLVATEEQLAMTHEELHQLQKSSGDGRDGEKPGEAAPRQRGGRRGRDRSQEAMKVLHIVLEQLKKVGDDIYDEGANGGRGSIEVASLIQGVLELLGSDDGKKDDTTSSRSGAIESSRDTTDPTMDTREGRHQLELLREQLQHIAQGPTRLDVARDAPACASAVSPHTNLSVTELWASITHFTAVLQAEMATRTIHLAELSEELRVVRQDRNEIIGQQSAQVRLLQEQLLDSERQQAALLEQLERTRSESGTGTSKDCRFNADGVSAKWESERSTSKTSQDSIKDSNYDADTAAAAGKEDAVQALKQSHLTEMEELKARCDREKTHACASLELALVEAQKGAAAALRAQREVFDERLAALQAQLQQQAHSSHLKQQPLQSIGTATHATHEDELEKLREELAATRADLKLKSESLRIALKESLSAPALPVERVHTAGDSTTGKSSASSRSASPTPTPPFVALELHDPLFSSRSHPFRHYMNSNHNSGDGQSPPNLEAHHLREVITIAHSASLTAAPGRQAGITSTTSLLSSQLPLQPLLRGSSEGTVGPATSHSESRGCSDHASSRKSSLLRDAQHNCFVGEEDERRTASSSLLSCAQLRSPSPLKTEAAGVPRSRPVHGELSCAPTAQVIELSPLQDHPQQQYLSIPMGKREDMGGFYTSAQPISSQEVLSRLSGGTNSSSNGGATVSSSQPHRRVTFAELVASRFPQATASGEITSAKAQGRNDFASVKPLTATTASLSPGSIHDDNVFSRSPSLHQHRLVWRQQEEALRSLTGSPNGR